MQGQEVAATTLRLGERGFLQSAGALAPRYTLALYEGWSPPGYLKTSNYPHPHLRVWLPEGRILRAQEPEAPPCIPGQKTQGIRRWSCGRRGCLCVLGQWIQGEHSEGKVLRRSLALEAQKWEPLPLLPSPLCCFWPPARWSLG